MIDRDTYVADSCGGEGNLSNLEQAPVNIIASSDKGELYNIPPLANDALEIISLKRSCNQKNL